MIPLHKHSASRPYTCVTMSLYSSQLPTTCMSPLGMADYQVLPPGLSQVTYKAETVDPNTFQINGRVLFFSAVYIYIVYAKQYRWFCYRGCSVFDIYPITGYCIYVFLISCESSYGTMGGVASY